MHRPRAVSSVAAGAYMHIACSSNSELRPSLVRPHDGTTVGVTTGFFNDGRNGCLELRKGTFLLYLLKQT